MRYGRTGVIAVIELQQVKSTVPVECVASKDVLRTVSGFASGEEQRKNKLPKAYLIGDPFFSLSTRTEISYRNENNAQLKYL